MAARGLMKGILVVCFAGISVFSQNSSQSSYDKAEEIKSPQLRKEIAQLRAEVKRLKKKVKRLQYEKKNKSTAPPSSLDSNSLNKQTTSPASIAPDTVY